MPAGKQTARQGTKQRYLLFLGGWIAFVVLMIVLWVRSVSGPGAIVEQPNVEDENVTVQTACVFGVVQDKFRMLATDVLPSNWPEEPYDGQPFQEKLNRSLRVYRVFATFGTNTLFTAVGIALVAMFGFAIHVNFSADVGGRGVCAQWNRNGDVCVSESLCIVVQCGLDVSVSKRGAPDHLGVCVGLSSRVECGISPREHGGTHHRWGAIDVALVVVIGDRPTRLNSMRACSRMLMRSMRFPLSRKALARLSQLAPSMVCWCMAKETRLIGSGISAIPAPKTPINTTVPLVSPRPFLPHHYPQDPIGSAPWPVRPRWWPPH